MLCIFGGVRLNAHYFGMGKCPIADYVESANFHGKASRLANLSLKEEILPQTLPGKRHCSYENEIC